MMRNRDLLARLGCCDLPCWAGRFFSTSRRQGCAFLRKPGISSRPWPLRGSSSPDHSPSDPVSDPPLSLSQHSCLRFCCVVWRSYGALSVRGSREGEGRLERARPQAAAGEATSCSVLMSLKVIRDLHSFRHALISISLPPLPPPPPSSQLSNSNLDPTDSSIPFRFAFRPPPAPPCL